MVEKLGEESIALRKAMVFAWAEQEASRAGVVLPYDRLVYEDEDVENTLIDLQLVIAAAKGRREGRNGWGSGGPGGSGGSGGPGGIKGLEL